MNDSNLPPRYSVRFKELERGDDDPHRLIIHADVPTLVIAVPLEGVPAFRQLASSEGEKDHLLTDLLAREGIGEGVLALLRAGGADKPRQEPL